MKSKSLYFSGIAVITLMMPAAADTIYSNLQNIAIPNTFTGVYLDLNGATYDVGASGSWDINPFFGGSVVGNSSTFQPTRTGTTATSSLQNVAVGEALSSTSGHLYDTSLSGVGGFGGSWTHLGSTFTSGDVGYLGFKLIDGEATNYGWMRVKFTNNTGTPEVLDWAYDDSGSEIVVGRVQQSAAVLGAQTVTLSPGTDETFTLGSEISDTDGNTNSVIKTGAGTTILSVANSYTGDTTVSAGTLALTDVDAASSGVIKLTGATAVLDIAAGGNTIANDITISAAGASVRFQVDPAAAYTVGTDGALTSEFASSAPNTSAIILDGANSDALATVLEMGFSGSSTATNDNIRLADVFSLNGIATGDALVLQLTATGLGTDRLLAWQDGSGLWDLAVAGNTGTAGSLAGSYATSYDSFLDTYNSGVFDAVSMLGAYGYDNGSAWAVINHGGNFTVVPEPTSALAVVLLGAGLLRRRRN